MNLLNIISISEKSQDPLDGVVCTTTEDENTIEIESAMVSEPRLDHAIPT